MPPPPPLLRRAMPWAGAVVLAVLTGLAAWTLRPVPAPEVTRFSLSLPPDESLLLPNAPCPNLALSPDGRLLAFITQKGSQQQLYLRAMDSIEATQLPGAAGAQVYNPFFSPDGHWLAFGVDGRLMKVPTSGGAPVTVGNVLYCMAGVAWGADDTIVFRRPEGFLQIPAQGGTAERATLKLSDEDLRLAAFPEFLPGGNALLFTLIPLPNASYDDNPIVVQRLDTGERRVLNQNGLSPHYVSTGHLVFARAGAILAVPFDLKRLEVTGGPVTLVQGLARTGDGVSVFAVSQNRTLAYNSGPAQEAASQTLVWVDRKGAVQPVGAPPGAYSHPQLSPDGRQVALTVAGAKNDVWIYDLARGTLTRLTFEGNNTRPLWTPDGKRIVFLSIRGGKADLFWKPADGTGAEEQITSVTDVNFPSSISLDGKLAFYYVNDPKTNRDLWTVPLEGEHKPAIFLQTPFDEASPKISPDGRWLAYASDESGRREVYVRSFPGPGGKWQISTDGGGEPLWARNGRELFYRSGDKMMAVDINQSPDRQGGGQDFDFRNQSPDRQGGGAFQAGTPRMLFEGKYERRTLEANWDVSPDGQRFLMIQPNEQQAQAPMQINVVVNWAEELKQRVPVP